MTRIVLGPFNRVEGDLELSLDLAAGRVQAAYVNSPLFRGFEQILIGRAPLDALAIVPRICGICSVAQSAAAASALAEAMGLAPPPNGQLARHLIQATENLADHLTHFYLFFMPDFARPAYASRPWHAAAEVLPAVRRLVEPLAAPGAVADWRVAVGCPHCQGTGYRGRLGIYELVDVVGLSDDRIGEELAIGIRHLLIDVLF